MGANRIANLYAMADVLNTKIEVDSSPFRLEASKRAKIKILDLTIQADSRIVSHADFPEDVVLLYRVTGNLVLFVASFYREFSICEVQVLDGSKFEANAFFEAKRPANLQDAAVLIEPFSKARFRVQGPRGTWTQMK